VINYEKPPKNQIIKISKFRITTDIVTPNIFFLSVVIIFTVKHYSSRVRRVECEAVILIATTTSVTFFVKYYAQNNNRRNADNTEVSYFND